jgi:hypothetical protein
MNETARFTVENKAVFDRYDEFLKSQIKIEFVMNDGILSVSALTDMSVMFGMGVSINGEYIKGKPTYINADIVTEVLGDNAGRVKELIGDGAFKGLVSVMEEGSRYEDDVLTYSGFIRGAGMGAELLIDGGKIHCLALNLDADFDGYTFYTNDVNYKKELPAVMKKNLIDSWKLRFVYKELN